MTDPIPLIVLDVQDAINQPIWDGKNNPDYIAVIERLLAKWRASDWPVIHVKHDEATPTSTYYKNGPWNAIQSRVAPHPSEPIIVKHQNCAFIGTELDATLRRLGANSFVLVGVVIHNSMDATIRAGKALGYHIFLPEDATTAVPVKGASGRVWDAQDVFDLTLAILGGEYAKVCSSDDVMKWLKP
ncbi:MAG: isochorismatase family protein [Pseudomonadota bacterium]